MGVCLSCLGLGPDDHGRAADNEPSETSRLLREDERPIEYGSSDPDLMPIPDLEEDDEQQEQQMKAWLNKTWRETSDKLIDISHLTHSSEPHSISDHDNSSKTAQDYQRFFDDTFKTARRPQSSGRPAIHRDTFVPPRSQNEQDWLRSIILKDPNDESWDCNRVQKIGKPLIISFDEAVANDENEPLSSLG